MAELVLVTLTKINSTGVTERPKEAAAVRDQFARRNFGQKNRTCEGAHLQS